VIDREPDLDLEADHLVALLGGDVSSGVGKGGRVGHVNGDGVTVSERDLRGELEDGRPGVT
jgi:hypothetical protein